MPGDTLLGPISQTLVLYLESFRKEHVKGEDVYPGSCDSEMIEMS